MNAKIVYNDSFKELVLTDAQGVLKICVYTDYLFTLEKAKKIDNTVCFKIENGSEYYNFFYKWYKKLDDSPYFCKKDKTRTKLIFKGEAPANIKNDSLEVDLVNGDIELKFVLNKEYDFGWNSGLGDVLIRGLDGGSAYKPFGILAPTNQLLSQIEEYENNKGLEL
ncbi:MAG: hypothetical protein AB7S44_00835 [Spirochaetales bacterium]